MRFFLIGLYILLDNLKIHRHIIAKTNNMTAKMIKSESWWVMDLVNKINNHVIQKPKFQRKRKWDVSPKKDNVPNEQGYIFFLFDTKNSVQPILLGENDNKIYRNVDGNNRLNAIAHFINKPFEIFPEFLTNLFAFIENDINCTEEIKNEIKQMFKSMSYREIINLKLHKYMESVGKKCLYEKYLLTARDTFDDYYLEEIQKKLKINGELEFDKNVTVNVNICMGYSESELNEMYVAVNKYNNKMSEIDLLAGRLYGINNFTIQNNVLHSAIKDELVKFYNKKSKDEVLVCYQFDLNEKINAYDFMVGFQNYANKQCFLIEEVDDSGLPLFFKLYKTLYSDNYENSFNDDNINNFTGKIIKAIEKLNLIINEIVTDNLNGNSSNIFEACNKKMHSLKKNNVYLILTGIIAYVERNEPDNILKKNIEKCLLYHFFVQDISDTATRTSFQVSDTILFNGGGTLIDNKADNIYKNPDLLHKDITKELMVSLLKTLLNENVKSSYRHLPSGKKKKDKRRSRKFYEKTLIYYYYKQHVPTNLLNNTFWIEHIFLFSSLWDGQLDIDRLGNIIPIIDFLNAKRSNKHISEYKKYDSTGFIKFINMIIPDHDTYDSIISHNSRNPAIINVEKFNNYCEKNENEYVTSFLNCIF